MPEASTSRQSIPPRRSRLAEVIDVDAIPDDNARPAQRRRMNTSGPAQVAPPVAGPSTSARQDPIVIYDSDEEVERGLFVDTPPRRPLLPPNVRRLERLPSHRDITRPQRYSPPPAIIPIAQPFSFEAQLSRPSRRAPAPAPAPQAAPRSHHQPSMGLGGALIATNRQNAVEDAYRRRHHQPQLPPARRTTVYRNDQPAERSTSWGVPGLNDIRNFAGHAWRSFWGQPDQQHEDQDEQWRYLENEGWLPQANPGWPAPIHEEMPMPPPFRKPKVTVYEQSYTHPGMPPSGFTWDFADPDPSEDAATLPSKKVIVLDEADVTMSDDSQPIPQMTATLVCARCMDPLVLPAQTASTAENKDRRVWSLRCGHMFDGKCIANLMQPHSEDTEKAVLDKDVASDAKSVPVIDRKGKGKAVDRGAPYPIPQRDEVGSIRSRLRPRRGVASNGHDVGAAVASPSEPAQEAEGPSGSRTLRPSSKRARISAAEVTGAPTKGKGRKSRRQRYTWQCPVPECGLDHASVLPAGENEWIMDPHKGGMPLFV